MAFKVFGIIVSIIVGIAAGGQPILGYKFGANNHTRVKQTMKLILISSAIVGLVSTMLFEFCPGIFLFIFGNGGAGVNLELYESFTKLTFRIYLGFIFFTCIIKVISIFFQAIGSPVKATLLSMCRDVIFLVPTAIIFACTGGVKLLLWSAGVADILGFILAVILFVVFIKKYNKTMSESD